MASKTPEVPSTDDGATSLLATSLRATNSSSPGAPSDNDCAICYEPLLVPTKDDKLSALVFLDDVKLKCNHHFHMSCIMEYAAAAPNSWDRCAYCRANVLNKRGEFMVLVCNEGGNKGYIEIGEDIEHAAFLRANPEEWRKERFLDLMSAKELEEAELFLKGEDPDANGRRMNPNVEYEGGLTALHMAAMNNDVDGIRLLLRYGADKNFGAGGVGTALEAAREVQGSCNVSEAIALLEQSDN